MPTFYMLIGVPGAGKSTYVNKMLCDVPSDTVVVSTDNLIDSYAQSVGKSYTEVFTKFIKVATSQAKHALLDAVAQNKDIILDQTNTTAKSRAAKLAAIPDHYRKVAVFFPTPAAKELERRLASRPGKHIPWNILQGMISQLEAPTTDEGFDEVVVVS